jgi:hypothetical protein
MRATRRDRGHTKGDELKMALKPESTCPRMTNPARAPKETAAPKLSLRHAITKPADIKRSRTMLRESPRNPGSRDSSWSPTKSK